MPSGFIIRAMQKNVKIYSSHLFSCQQVYRQAAQRGKSGRILFILAAVAVAVEEVDEDAERTPDPEALPGHRGEVVHDVAAAHDGERADDVDGRAAERARRSAASFCFAA